MWIWVILVIPYITVSFLLPMFKSLTVDFSDMIMAVGALVYTLGVGVLEETAYRGVIQTTFYQKWAGAPKGIFKAVFVSALYFGIVHLANLAGGANLVLTLAQVIYTVVLGVFFGAMLVYSKSIWPSIVAHWLLDCASGLVGSGKSPETDSLFLSVLFVGAILPVGIAALWMLRQAARRQLGLEKGVSS